MASLRLKLNFYFSKLVTGYFSVENIRSWFAIDHGLDCKVKDLEKIILKRFRIRNLCRIRLTLENCSLPRSENISIIHDNDTLGVEVLPKKEQSIRDPKTAFVIVSKIHSTIEDTDIEYRWWEEPQPSHSKVPQILDDTPLDKSKVSKKRKLAQEHRENIDTPDTATSGHIATKEKTAVFKSEVTLCTPQIKHSHFKDRANQGDSIVTSAPRHAIVSVTPLSINEKLLNISTANSSSQKVENADQEEQGKKKRKRGQRGRSRKNKSNNAPQENVKPWQNRVKHEISRPYTPRNVSVSAAVNGNHVHFEEDEGEQMAEEPSNNGMDTEPERTVSNSSVVEEAIESLQRKKSYMEHYRNVTTDGPGNVSVDAPQFIPGNVSVDAPKFNPGNVSVDAPKFNTGNVSVDAPQFNVEEEAGVAECESSVNNSECLNYDGELQCKTLPVRAKNKNSALFASAKVFSRQRRKPVNQDVTETPFSSKPNNVQSVTTHVKERKEAPSKPVTPMATVAPPAPTGPPPAPVKSYEKCSPLHGAPRSGDVIAYKILEMSSSYTPEVSAYKEAKVLSFDPVLKQVTLEHTAMEKADNHEGRFEINIEDDETILKSRTDPELIVTVSLSSLIDTRLVLSN